MTGIEISVFAVHEYLLSPAIKRCNIYYFPLYSAEKDLSVPGIVLNTL